jgi:Fe-S-cluster containining protein
MNHDDLALLCQQCALCCDGSLFGRVPLDASEVAAARRHRLRVVAGGASFEQPCAALEPSGPPGDERRGCSMYAERPLACRRFECVLYDRHRREGGPLEARLDVVRRVRALIAVALAGGGHDELARILETEFARASSGGTPPP